MSMKYVAVYLMLSLGGNDSPTVEDIKNVLNSVGIEADTEQANTVVKNAKGKSTQEIIVNGLKKLQSVPSGGGAAVASKGPAAKADAPASKKEEKKEEVKEESEDEDMGFSLFD